MIRRTWAQEYLVPYSSTKRIFVLGINPTTGSLQQKIAQEHQVKKEAFPLRRKQRVKAFSHLR